MFSTSNGAHTRHILGGVIIIKETCTDGEGTTGDEEIKKGTKKKMREKKSFYEMIYEITPSCASTSLLL